jgi:hypothetical protein
MNPKVTNFVKVHDLTGELNILFDKSGYDVYGQVAITPAVDHVDIQTLIAMSPNACSAILNVLHDNGYNYTGTWEDLNTGGMITVPVNI